MKVEGFSLQSDDDRNEFLTFAGGPTKTRQGGLSANTRLVTLKMFTTRSEERCLVMLFKAVPAFYLTVIDKPVSSIWYKKTPVGENTINTIMKKNSLLKDLCPEKNLTNHSARKTVVTEK